MKGATLRKTLALAGGGAVWVAIVLLAFTGTAGAVLPGLLPTTTTSSSTSSTTTTAIADPSGLLGDMLGAFGPTSTTTTPPSTTTTTTVVSPTTTPTGTDRGGNTIPGDAVGTRHTVGDERTSEPATVGVVGSTASAATSATQRVEGNVSRTLPVSAGAVGKQVFVRTAAASGPAAGLPVAARSTSALLGRLDGLQLGPSAIARLLAPFPVAGRASYTSDFGARRLEPEPHVHEGTDIFAESGTPVIASADGDVDRFTYDTPIGGNSLRLTAAGGTYFVYAHLTRFAPDLRPDGAVRKGDVLGFVGATGNARDTAPHLHYEIHPQAGAAVDPVPYLDRWLADATRSIESMDGVSSLNLRGPSARGAASVRPPTAAVAPAAADLGNAQTISATGVAPAALMLALTGAVLAGGHIKKRRARR